MFFFFFCITRRNVISALVAETFCPFRSPHPRSHFGGVTLTLLLRLRALTQLGIIRGCQHDEGDGGRSQKARVLSNDRVVIIHDYIDQATAMCQIN